MAPSGLPVPHIFPDRNGSFRPDFRAGELSFQCRHLSLWPPMSRQLEFDEILLINVFLKKQNGILVPFSHVWQGSEAPGSVLSPPSVVALTVHTQGHVPSSREAVLEGARGLWKTLAHVVPVVLHVYTGLGPRWASVSPALLQPCGRGHPRGNSPRKCHCAPKTACKSVVAGSWHFGRGNGDSSVTPRGDREVCRGAATGYGSSQARAPCARISV